MIHFPILESLQIDNYGLFPGQNDHTLTISFMPGITLILGANGIGKTTLITMLYRMMTGPKELPWTSMGSELGGASLAPRDLTSLERATFANRVHDGAKDSKAALTFSLGTKRIVIKRRLKDLSLLALSIEDSLLTPNETVFQDKIGELAGVWSFGDWLLMLRHLVFYFEDRRALVWDPSAQKQLFRFLFLSSDVAEKWYKDEREILRLDSEARNDNAVLGRLRRSVVAEEKKQQHAGDVKAQLETLESIQATEETALERVVYEISQKDELRKKIRLDLLKNEHELEDVEREIERAKLIAIRSHFPTQNEIGQYLIAQLIVDEKCAACANSAEEMAREYSSRMDAGECILCGNTINEWLDTTISKQDLSDGRIEKLRKRMHKIRSVVTDQHNELANINHGYFEVAKEIETLRVRLDERRNHIDTLIRALPADDARIRDNKENLAAIQQLVDEKKARVFSLGKSFKEFVQNVTRNIQTRSDEIKSSFNGYSEGFLLESCELKWTPKEIGIGQLGVRVEFPSFGLDMSGVDFPTPVRRDGPDQVSESQREFIDLAFRMALMSVVGGVSGGSLLIDAPESSLDGIFVERAAEVLGRFGSPDSPNRLVISSNLVQGELIPSIIQKAIPPDEAPDRVVDLLALATPTAAVREKQAEYSSLLQSILKRGGISL